MCPTFMFPTFMCPTFMYPTFMYPTFMYPTFMYLYVPYQLNKSYWESLHVHWKTMMVIK